MDVQVRYFNEYNVKPYYRIAAYLVGIACADIYMKTKDRMNNMKENWWKVWPNCIMIFTAQTEANEVAHLTMEWNVGCEISYSKISVDLKSVPGTILMN